jgi:hypothetical protein
MKQQLKIIRRKRIGTGKFQDLVYQMMRQHKIGDYAGSLALLNQENMEKRKRNSVGR